MKHQISSYRHCFPCTYVILLAVEMLLNWRESQPMCVKSLGRQWYLSAVAWQNLLHKWQLCAFNKTNTISSNTPNNTHTTLFSCNFDYKMMGDDGGWHCLVQMEWRPPGWSVCLPLLIFPCTIKSRSSLLALGKRAIKRLWCVSLRNDSTQSSWNLMLSMPQRLDDIFSLTENSNTRMHARTHTHTHARTHAHTHTHTPGQWHHPWLSSTALASQQHTAAVLRHCWMAPATAYSTRTSSSTDQHRGTTAGHADLHVHSIQQT